MAIKTTIDDVEGFLAPFLTLWSDLVFNLAVVAILELLEYSPNLLFAFHSEPSTGFRKISLDVKAFLAMEGSLEI